MKSHLLGATCAGFILLSNSEGLQANTISFSDFSDVSQLTINGDASQIVNATSNHVLRLTPNLTSRVGSFYVTQPVNLSNGSGAFSAAFSFQITEPGGDFGGADGLTFVLQSNSATALGEGGGGLGYRTMPNSIAIEFDTVRNNNTTPSNNDISSNHVGIDINGDVNSIAQVNLLDPLKSGSIFYGWVDYDGQEIEARLSTSNSRPIDALVSATLDIPAILGVPGTTFVGFTAGTGGGYANHDILSFEFSPVPIPPALWLFGTGLIGLVGIARRRAIK